MRSAQGALLQQVEDCPLDPLHVTGLDEWLTATGRDPADPAGATLPGAPSCYAELEAISIPCDRLCRHLKKVLQQVPDATNYTLKKYTPLVQHALVDLANALAQSGTQCDPSAHPVDRRLAQIRLWATTLGGQVHQRLDADAKGALREWSRDLHAWDGLVKGISVGAMMADNSWPYQ